MNRSLFLLLSLIIFWTACKKDNPEPASTPAPTPTTQEILLSHYWKLNTHHSTHILDTDGDGILEVQRFTTLDTCISNAKRYFQLNNYFKTIYTTTCVGYNPDSSTWHLTPDGSVLTLGSVDYNIFSISSSQLKIAVFLQELNPQVFVFDTLIYNYP